MRNVINRMGNMLVQEVDSAEENKSPVEDPPTGPGFGSAPHEVASKCLATKTTKVTFARQVQIEPNTTEVNLQNWGYTATSAVSNTHSNPSLSDSSLPNLKSIDFGAVVAVSKQTRLQDGGFSAHFITGCLLSHSRYIPRGK